MKELDEITETKEELKKLKRNKKLNSIIRTIATIGLGAFAVFALLESGIAPALSIGIGAIICHHQKKKTKKLLEQKIRSLENKEKVDTKLEDVEIVINDEKKEKLKENLKELNGNRAKLDKQVNNSTAVATIGKGITVGGCVLSFLIPALVFIPAISILPTIVAGKVQTSKTKQLTDIENKSYQINSLLNPGTEKKKEKLPKEEKTTKTEKIKSMTEKIKTRAKETMSAIESKLEEEKEEKPARRIIPKDIPVRKTEKKSVTPEPAYVTDSSSLSHEEKVKIIDEYLKRMEKLDEAYDEIYGKGHSRVKK